MTKLQIIADINESLEEGQLTESVVPLEIPDSSKEPDVNIDNVWDVWENIEDYRTDPFNFMDECMTAPVSNECLHPEIEFSHPGTGKYDIYRCKICKNTIVRNWA